MHSTYLGIYLYQLHGHTLKNTLLLLLPSPASVIKCIFTKETAFPNLRHPLLPRTLAPPLSHHLPTYLIHPYWAHSTPLYSTPLHFPPLQSTPLHFPPLYSTHQPHQPPPNRSPLPRTLLNPGIKMKWYLALHGIIRYLLLSESHHSISASFRER